MHLPRRRLNNYEFNINRMTSFEGDTGPYLQYAHARLCSIVRRVGIPYDTLHDADLSLLTSGTSASHSSHAALLIRSLAQWPDVFNNTLKTLEPVTVLIYLFKMTHMLSSSYDHLKILGSDPELARARLALYECARQVLNEGMKLLGLSPVDRYVIETDLRSRCRGRTMLLYLPHPANITIPHPWPSISLDLDPSTCKTTN